MLKALVEKVSTNIDNINICLLKVIIDWKFCSICYCNLRINILTLCVEKGEPAFWQRKGEFLTSHTIKPQIKDTVLVQPVNLVDYDQLYQKGAVAQCKIQV